MELVRITAAAAVDGPSTEGGRGVDGGGLDKSCAWLQLNEIRHAAAMAAHTLTLMLTPNLPFLRFLETVSAVDRNAVLVVIAQEYVGVFACALIADAERKVGC